MIRSAWKKWKKIAEKIGGFQFELLFSILYWLFVFPFGIVSNLFGDFLKLRGISYWQKTEDNVSTLAKLREQ